ncbi:ABC transporter substrate-binding protein [Desulfobulbus oligotrophicus]|uniref:Thiamine pyrimidine synthase n=2 Tax=Desulfobulbus oligotrophicus TaxID=1909699 RepID=A0A7T5VF71_9BACT|nr:ABC transporter substrate-binding protein [Desulfobulbus oligotrophicus]
MKNTAQRCIQAVLLLLMTTLLVTNTASASDTVRYRLKWLRNASVVGDLYAEAGHLFEKAGLDVEIKPGGPERDAIRELELGHADFGVASADQVLRARVKGSPVVVIAQLFQVNPLQWMYRPENMKINSPADLKGKDIGVTFGGNDETIMRTLLAEAGLGESDIKLFSVRYDYTPFYRRKIQLWPVYRNAQGPIITAQLNKVGEQITFFNPADFGVKFVANSVVTHSRTLTEKPDLVRRFLEALLSGWQQALDPKNENEVLAILQKYDPDTPPPIQKEQLKITRELVQPQPSQAIGTIDKDAWAQTQQIMFKQKLLPQQIDLKEILKPVGTTTN